MEFWASSGGLGYMLSVLFIGSSVNYLGWHWKVSYLAIIVIYFIASIFQYLSTDEVTIEERA